MGECEWKTCNACKDKCEHVYEPGLVHGGNAGMMAPGEFCGKCGRGKPEDPGVRQKTKIENELAVERELGIKVIYKNLPGGMGPNDVVQYERFKRRLLKARARTATAAGV